MPGYKIIQGTGQGYFMQKIIIYFFLVVFLLPNVARATEAYNFMTAIIESLQSVKIADDRGVPNLNDNDHEVIIMKDIMVYNNELKKASSFIKPYTSSKSEIIKLAATTFYELYSLIILNNESVLSLYENTLNNIEDLATKRGTLSRKLSEIGASNDMLYRKIPEVTALSTHALVDKKRSLEDGKVMFLKISPDEIESLIDQLVSAFGEGIKSEPKAGILPLDFSATLLYSFFANGDKGWKPADAK
ncbi:MAG: hypothetical protein SCARUB_00384 [Candidatus Scalindua rubra]|uniref:Uncharacterized protein n=1 Tax=Candidatus Scalindua rubra TaxID=1872076 RepID=A0A1E3XFY5_9BACT|nr:MAG: hypothetical protein SCARUB_00384 [Candidatus Scalindua rubra]